MRAVWRLNERHYGALQGKDKKQTLERVRRGAVHALAPLLRRPAAAAGRRREFSQAGDPRYADLRPSCVPRTECLEDVVARMLPYWETTIVPDLRAGKTVLVAAHGNSLRALVKHLDGICDDDDRRRSTSRPASRCSTGWTTTSRPTVPGGEYLDPEAAADAVEAVANQGR